LTWIKLKLVVRYLAIAFLTELGKLTVVVHKTYDTLKSSPLFNCLATLEQLVNLIFQSALTRLSSTQRISTGDIGENPHPLQQISLVEAEVPRWAKPSVVYRKGIIKVAQSSCTWRKTCSGVAHRARKTSDHEARCPRFFLQTS
jgi:hypothetical protein